MEVKTETYNLKRFILSLFRKTKKGSQRTLKIVALNKLLNKYLHMLSKKVL